MSLAHNHSRAAARCGRRVGAPTLLFIDAIFTMLREKVATTRGTQFITLIGSGFTLTYTGHFALSLRSCDRPLK